jgi:hypothetical protein
MTRGDRMLGVLAGFGVFIAALLLLRRLPEIGVTVTPFRPDRLGELGTVIKVDERLEGDPATGRVQIGPESWRAIFQQERPEVDKAVRVVDRKNLTLICAPLSAQAIEGPDPKNAALPRLVAGFGRVAAGFLCILLAVPTYFAIVSAPSAVGIGFSGLLAPFVCVLGLICMGSLRSSDEAGLSVRRLRAIIAATCGFVAYTAISVSLAVSLLPLAAAVVLAMFDPVLGEALAMITMGFGVSDG